MSETTPVGYQSYHDEPQGYNQKSSVSSDDSNDRQLANVSEYNDLTDAPASVGALTAFMCVAGFLYSLFFLLVEKHNRYIRFWAYQNVVTHLAFFILTLIHLVGEAADPAGARGWGISLMVFWLIELILGVFLAVHAYRGARTGFFFKVPIVGPMAVAFALNAAPPASNVKIQTI